MSAQPRKSSPDLEPRCRISRCRELNGSLSVTVDSSRLLHIRRAIVRAGREHVGIVKAASLAGGTRMRLLIACDPKSMHSIMQALAGAMK